MAAGHTRQNLLRNTWRFRRSTCRRAITMNVRDALLTKTAPMFAALGDPIHLTMVALLSANGSLPTILLKQATSVSRQAVTKHLRMLEETGIVTSQRVGRNRLWQIETQQLREIRGDLDRISDQWDTTLERLRRFVENDSQ